MSPSDLAAMSAPRRPTAEARSVFAPSAEMLDALLCAKAFQAQGVVARRNGLSQRLSSAAASLPEFAALFEEVRDELQSTHRRLCSLERYIESVGSFSSSGTAPQAIPLGQVAGAELRWVNASSVSLGTLGQPSAARDSTNTIAIAWSGAVGANITVAGAGGLDAGVEAPNTWYAVHAISSSSLPTAALLSLSATAPVLPAGYAYFRRLGWVRNDAASNFLPFLQRFEGVDRVTWWDDLPLVLVGGAAVVFTAVSCAAFVPPTAKQVHLLTGYTNAAGVAADFFLLRPAGFTFFLPPWAGLPGIVHPSIATVPYTMPTNDVQAIEYSVSNPLTNLTLVVQGYVDSLHP